MQTTTNIPETDFINPNWILLDTCYTISSVRNRYLVKDIRACGAGEEIWAYTNGGHQDYSYTATIVMLSFEVFKKKSLAKILSFSAVARKFRITINKDLDPAINLHPENNTIIIFNKFSGIIYYFDTTNMEITLLIDRLLITLS